MDIDIEKLKKHLAELENGSDADSIPLTKTKKSKEPTEPQNEPPKEQPPKEKKPRKPKTEKQMESFAKVKEIRDVKLKEKDRQKKIEAGKAYLAELERLKGSQEKEKHVEQAPPKPKKQVVESESSSSSSEEEVVHIKKDKKKKKKKKIVIVDSSSDSSSSSSSEEEKVVVEKKAPKKDFGKSHQNKKSSVSVNYTKPQEVKNDKWKNYFCD